MTKCDICGRGPCPEPGIMRCGTGSWQFFADNHFVISCIYCRETYKKEIDAIFYEQELMEETLIDFIATFMCKWCKDSYNRRPGEWKYERDEAGYEIKVARWYQSRRKDCSCNYWEMRDKVWDQLILTKNGYIRDMKMRLERDAKKAVENGEHLG